MTFIDNAKIIRVQIIIGINEIKIHIKMVRFYANKRKSNSQSFKTAITCRTKLKQQLTIITLSIPTSSRVVVYLIIQFRRDRFLYSTLFIIDYREEFLIQIKKLNHFTTRQDLMFFQKNLVFLTRNSDDPEQQFIITF